MGSKLSGGRPKTPEERLKKIAAARARWSRPKVKQAREVLQNPTGDPESRAPGQPPLPSDRPTDIADYDRVLGLPVSWNDAKAREAVLATLEDARRNRGEVVTRQEAEEACMLTYSAFGRGGAQLPVLVVESLAGVLDMETRAKVRAAVEKAWDAIMDEIGRKASGIE